MAFVGAACVLFVVLLGVFAHQLTGGALVDLRGAAVVAINVAAVCTGVFCLGLCCVGVAVTWRRPARDRRPRSAVPLWDTTTRRADDDQRSAPHPKTAGSAHTGGCAGPTIAHASERQVAAWRARAAALYPSDLRAAPEAVRLTLLAALCWARTAEITDALVDLLLELVHGIGARAENRVERELISDLRRVRGKEGILFRLAEAAVEHPDDTVRNELGGREAQVHRCRGRASLV